MPVATDIDMSQETGMANKYEVRQVQLLRFEKIIDQAFIESKN